MGISCKFTDHWRIRVNVLQGKTCFAPESYLSHKNVFRCQKFVKKTTTPKDSSNTRPFVADENISKVCSKIDSATKELISR